jgi:hypothetical protein
VPLQTALKVQLNEVIDSLTQLPAVEFPSVRMPEMPNISVPEMPDISSLWSDENELAGADGSRAPGRPAPAAATAAPVNGSLGSKGAEAGRLPSTAPAPGAVTGGATNTARVVDEVSVRARALGEREGNQTRGRRTLELREPAASAAGDTDSTALKVPADVGNGPVLDGLSSGYLTAAQAAPSDSLSQTLSAGDERTGGREGGDARETTLTGAVTGHEDDLVKGTSFRQIWEDVFAKRLPSCHVHTPASLDPRQTFPPRTLNLIRCLTTSTPRHADLSAALTAWASR